MPPAQQGYGVTEAGGVVRITVDQTDAGGILVTQPLRIDPTQGIRIARRLLVHPANTHFTGYMLVSLLGGSGPEHVYWVTYAHETYSGYPYVPAEGIYLTLANLPTTTASDSERSQPTAAVWDDWFEEVVEYNPVTGEVFYYLNGALKITMCYEPLPLRDEYDVQFQFESYGWYTGHYTHMDDVLISQYPLEGGN